MIEFRINSKGFNAAIRRLINQATDRRPLMAQIGGILHNEIEENFKAEGRPHWVDLQDSTKVSREAKNKWPGKILQVSGQLVGSIQIQSDNDEALAGTNKVYGPTHEFGDSRRNIPARPFLTIPEKAQDEIEDAIRRYVLRGTV